MTYLLVFIGSVLVGTLSGAVTFFFLEKRHKRLAYDASKIRYDFYGEVWVPYAEWRGKDKDNVRSKTSDPS